MVNRYKDDVAYHRHMLRQSMSGNRLFQAFGDLYDQIVWDNVCPVPNGVTPDQKHICNSIDKHKPDLILTFGEIPKEALDDCTAALDTKKLGCHHPNARFKTQEDLNSFAMTIREYVMEKKNEIKSDESESH